MIKEKQIGSDGCSELFDCDFLSGSWIPSQSAMPCATSPTENLFLISINDVSSWSLCTTLAAFDIRNSILPFHISFRAYFLGVLQVNPNIRNYFMEVGRS